MRHPQATTTLIMGIISVLFPLLGPFVWYYGQRMLADIDKAVFLSAGAKRSLPVAHLVRS